jgi:DNA-binding response OmpR family regulator
MRRVPARQRLVVGDLRLNQYARSRGDREIELTNREFELLGPDAQRAPRDRASGCSRRSGVRPLAMTNTIGVFISNLRRKLEEEGERRPAQARRRHAPRRRSVVIRRPRERRRFSRLSVWPVRWRLAGVSAGLTL